MVTVMVQNVCHDGDSAETFLQLGRKADVPSLHAETSSPESEWFFINIKFAPVRKED